MSPLVILVISTSIQATIYLYCVVKRKNYIDTGIFGFAMLCNFWLFPKMLIDPTLPEQECAFSYNGMTLFFFVIFANTITVVLYLIYRLTRWLVE